MLLLILFAFIAGAATALSPCVLPVLPVVLSAGVTGGRAAARDRRRARALLHLRDRGAGLRDRRARAARRPPAHARDRRPARFRDLAADARVADRVEAWISR